MDRNLIGAHLAEAEDRVRLGAKHLASQRAVIVRLQQNKAYVYIKEAAKLLTLFEELQAIRIAHRDRLLDAFMDDLVAAGGSWWLSSARISSTAGAF
jgi:hypothetical protein